MLVIDEPMPTGMDLMAVNSLKRARLSITPSSLLAWVTKKYDLGEVKDYFLMEEGLTEINYGLVTDQGRYLVKVFPDKDEVRVADILNSLRIMHDKGFPVQRVYPSKDGSYYFGINPSQERQILGCVLSWFEGESLVGKDITDAQLRTIGRWLAEINRLGLQIRKVYDPWFTTSLPIEFHAKSQFTPNDKYIGIIQEIVDQLETVDFDQLHTGIVHGDLHREHLLQSDDGICILDFGALNVDKTVADLAIAMSHFCLDPNSFDKGKFLRNYRTMLNAYIGYRELSTYEIKTLPLLVKSSYATYYILGYYYFSVYQEEHAMYWVNIGRTGLEFVHPIETTKFIE